MAYTLQAVFVALAGIVAVFYSGKGVLVHRKISEIVHGKLGCLPVPEVGNVTIHYFAGRGRAEAFRLLLEEAGVPYQDMKFTKDNWPGYKIQGTNSGLYPYGQVPAIETSSGVKLAQSHAILHYLGRAYGYDCECEDQTHCEMIALGLEDVRSKLSKVLYDPEFSLKTRKEYLTVTMPLWLGYLEKQAPALSNQENAFFSGDRLTWVDFLAFDVIEANLEFVKYDFGKDHALEVDIFAQFPKLGNFYRHIYGRPSISKYLKSKRRFPFKIPNQPKELKK